MTWGVFPNSEIIQPTVVDAESFLSWKDEAFGLWLSEWASIYPKGSESAALFHRIYKSFYLVNIVDNDYIGSDIFAFVDELVASPVVSTVGENKSEQVSNCVPGSEPRCA